MKRIVKPKCPSCESSKYAVHAVYKNGDEYWECEKCYEVVATIKEDGHVEKDN